MSAQMYRIVLTGGPCGGKSTVQAILTDTFQNMGWKVFRVPEAASILLGGGVLFSELNHEQAFQFQLHLLKVMLTLEDTYAALATSMAHLGQKCIVICDRGAMDGSAYVDRASWLKILKEVNEEELELRDARYDCVVHLVSAAVGAEKFYSTADHCVRNEGIELARQLDYSVVNAWLGHPYLDVIDNSTGFQEKLQRVVEAVCKRLGLKDNRGRKAVKRKFLVKEWPFDNNLPVKFEDFDVQHHYLLTTDGTQVRLRRRGQNGVYTFTCTVRKPEVEGQHIEIRRNLTGREYDTLLAQRDQSRCTIVKKRRCFIYQNQYFQLDCYQSPHQGLVLMEVYLNDYLVMDKDESYFLEALLPPFIYIEKEVTKNPDYSMFNLSVANHSLDSM